MERSRSLERMALVAMLTFVAVEVRADQPDALKLLKGMTDYVSGQKTISAKFDASIEAVTHDLEKIQFNNSGEVMLVRPDKFHASRTGGYADVELTFDGKTATILSKGDNAYAQLPVAGSTDQMFDHLRSDFGMQIPGADLLVTNAFDVLSRDVVQSKYIGPAVINGVVCEHLAFRNEETDWQVWVRQGPEAIPCKLVITSKAVTGAPQYTMTVKEWKTDAAPADTTFSFAAPAGAQSVKLEELKDIDELPAGVVKGGAQ